MSSTGSVLRERARGVRDCVVTSPAPASLSSRSIVPTVRTVAAAGKSDSIDAEAAARAALNGTATRVPKARDGDVEAIRVLRVVRRSAMQGRVRALHQLRAFGVLTAPQEVRDQLRGLNRKDLLDVCSRMRVSDAVTTTTARRSLVLCAPSPDGSTPSPRSSPGSTWKSRRWLRERVPNCSSYVGSGPTARRSCWSRPATTVNVCGAKRRSRKCVRRCSSLEASSGRVRRHRLNRGGDRQANHAALADRVGPHALRPPAPVKYVARRRAEGLSTREIMRCLKRYVAREDLRRPHRPLTTIPNPTRLDRTQLPSTARARTTTAHRHSRRTQNRPLTNRSIIKLSISCSATDCAEIPAE